MAEYIEREAFREVLEKSHKAHASNSREESLLDRDIRLLNEQPSADVAPVVHGRWIDKGEYAVCTECGGRSGTQYDGVEPIPLMTQFCPNCGAKTDGEPCTPSK